ncbi:biotrophy-associated secreted protein 2 [Ophiostoma piceae UAMH 11346]|uniref:Biotrophy-associated secreted protein 2 n=1 Tax=Ophiostoma piceae (strain UAMH 11346) TaxID=1262450 RepID=S3D5A2_OPHP1|nr:biotrophy-associated secreted protein 2 [Ophiostoma piceae UAMH 11346]
MARLSALLALIAAVSAIPSPLTPDPNGDHLVGNGQGEQFITGGCLSTADCSQATVHSCCAFISGGGTTGICSGFDVANINGKAGCGFGDGGAASSAAAAPAATSAAAVAAAPAASAASSSSGTCTVNTALAGSANVGTGAGTQFITGQCFSAVDCASGCCVAQADGTNLCKAELVTTEAGLSCDASCTPSTASAVVVSKAVAASSGTCTVNTALAGSANVGTGAGTQFITGQCFSAADCASGCCVAQADGTNLCKAELVTTSAGLSCDATCDGAAPTNTTDTPAAATSAASAPASTGAAGSAQCTVDTSLAGSASVGTGAGTQFITGQCLSAADCASGCCVAQASGVALCKAELLTTQSGLSCDFSCSA